MVPMWNNKEFKEIMSNVKYSLPIESFKISYEEKLNDLLESFKNTIDPLLTKREKNKLESICNSLKKAVNAYYKGYPSEAYKEIEKLMNKLSKNPLGKLEKSNSRLTQVSQEEMTPLYRMIKPFKNEGEEYSKKDLFHLPYYLRKRASSCRYSIAGYPSLYLGTSIELCASEINLSSGLVSSYQFSDFHCNLERPRIVVYDLAIKPSDFSSIEKIEEIRNWTSTDMYSKELRKNYVFWYPLIAACSFIRLKYDKKLNLFASEYIIPQLVMQWLRKQATKNELFGIRYFSSNSIKDSEKGYNYVFPVSGLRHNNTEYCPILAKSFKLSSPCWVELEKSVSLNKLKVEKNKDFDYIDFNSEEVTYN